MYKFYGIGTDLIEIGRVQQTYEKFGTKFLKKIFSESEVKLCKKRNFVESLAGKFAAKEAVFKAIKAEREELNWTEIEILNRKNGSPFVSLPKNFDNLQIEISISHTKNLAQAFCIVFKL